MYMCILSPGGGFLKIGLSHLLGQGFWYGQYTYSNICNTFCNDLETPSWYDSARKEGVVMNSIGIQTRLNARNGLIISSILYLTYAASSTLIAVRENLPSATFITFLTTGKPALDDFLTGNGTALSPPLYLCIAAILLLILACLPGWPGRVGIAGLTMLGIIFLSGIFVEKLTYRVLNPATFDFHLAIVELFAIVLPLLMIVFGGMEIAHKRSGSS
jgi:hypothetical protein